MAIFRFRVTFEDYDDVYRDNEIKSSQTFKDFHEAIQQSISFDNKHGASFFVSDDYWRKGTEVTLLKDDLEEGVKLMEKIKIAALVEDPHQHFVYVYDKNVQWSFHVQLLKILKDETSGSFPAIVKSSGIAPKQYKPVNQGKEVSPTDMALSGLIQELNDEEVYKLVTDTPEEVLDEEDVKAVAGEEEEEDQDNEMSDDGEGEEGGDFDEGAREDEY